MPFQYAQPHAFAEVSIRAHAPETGGVYGVMNAREWIYIGASDNVRRALLEHLAQPGSLLFESRPTGFTFEACTMTSRNIRLGRLLHEYNPICNRSHR